MTQVTRRGLLGGAALGTIGLAACQTAPKAAEGFEGELAFLHGVASGDPLPGSVILWTRVTPLAGTGPVTVGIRFDVLYDSNRSLYANEWSPFIRVYF